MTQTVYLHPFIQRKLRILPSCEFQSRYAEAIPEAENAAALSMPARCEFNDFLEEVYHACIKVTQFSSLVKAFDDGSLMGGRFKALIVSPSGTWCVDRVFEAHIFSEITTWLADNGWVIPETEVSALCDRLGQHQAPRKCGHNYSV